MDIDGEKKYKINYNYRNDDLEDTIGTWMDVGNNWCYKMISTANYPSLKLKYIF